MNGAESSTGSSNVHRSTARTLRVRVGFSVQRQVVPEMRERTTLLGELAIVGLTSRRVGQRLVGDVEPDRVFWRARSASAVRMREQDQSAVGLANLERGRIFADSERAVEVLQRDGDARKRELEIRRWEHGRHTSYGSPGRVDMTPEAPPRQALS